MSENKYTTSEIAKKLNISEVEVKRIEKKAIKKLKNMNLSSKLKIFLFN